MIASGWVGKVHESGANIPSIALARKGLCGKSLAFAKAVVIGIFWN